MRGPSQIAEHTCWPYGSMVRDVQKRRGMKEAGKKVRDCETTAKNRLCVFEQEDGMEGTEENRKKRCFLGETQ